MHVLDKKAYGQKKAAGSNRLFEVQDLVLNCFNNALEASHCGSYRNQDGLRGCLQAWRVAHPPVRGHVLCATQPLVHVGFMKAWLAGGFNEKVINHIMQLVNRSRAGAGAQCMKIYVTGQMHLCPLVAFALVTLIHAIQCKIRSPVAVCPKSKHQKGKQTPLQKHVQHALEFLLLSALLGIAHSANCHESSQLLCSCIQHCAC